MKEVVELPTNSVDLALALIYALYKKGDINEVTYQKILNEYKRG